MNFLKKLFGEKQQTTNRPNIPSSAGSREYFAHLIDNHLQKLRRNAPGLESFLNEYFGEDAVANLAQMVAEKMRITQSDGQQHSSAFWRQPVFYQSSTLPVEMNQAKDWFVSRFGSYTKFIEGVWNSGQFQGADCSIWCHIICGGTKRQYWVHIAICSVKETAPISAAIMPIEFLTSEERQQLGL